jgi:hypothetical protein
MTTLTITPVSQQKELVVPTVVNVQVQYLRLRGFSSFTEWFERQPNALYIGRQDPHVNATASKWKNPFLAKKYGNAEAVRLYEEYVRKTPNLIDSICELSGKELGCWCKGRYPACHGDVLVKLFKEKCLKISPSPKQEKIQLSLRLRQPQEPQPAPKPNVKLDLQLNVDLDKESERFDFIVRAQLVTSAYKMDTFYATDRQTQKVVFVKGPYKSIQTAQIPVISTQLRQLLGLIYVPVEMVQLQPDLLKTPLGLRNTLDTQHKYPFLIFNNLCGTHFETITKESKMWSPTPVVNWDRMTQCRSFVFKEYTKDNAVLIQYITHLLYRYMVGASDLADRNFILSMSEHQLYSVDEDTLGKSISMFTALGRSPQKISMIIKIIERYQSTFIEVLNGWEQVIRNNPQFHEIAGEHYQFIVTQLQKIESDLLGIWGQSISVSSTTTSS